MEILAHCANAKENMHQAAEGFVPKADGIPSFSTVRSARSLFRGEVINKRLPDLYRVLPSAIPMLYAKQTQVIWGMMRELGRRIIQRMAEQRGRMQFWDQRHHADGKSCRQPGCLGLLHVYIRRRSVFL